MNNEIQRVTPFISPIRLQGGTMYVFNSASEDLTFSFNQNSERKFKFSKFALLNIPEIKNNAISNTIKLDAIPGAYNSVRLDNISNYNKLFSESFQNYCLNLETSLLSKSTYNFELPKSVSERVFFKWLKELGGIRFSSTNINELQNNPRFKEEEDNLYYNRVVKYIGDIDYINNYFGTENTYSEVYVHIPTEVGDFSNVFFKSISDNNYSEGMTIGKLNRDLNSEVLMGRTYNDIHPYGLNTLAYYDNPSGLNDIGEETLTQLKYYKKIVGRNNNQNSEVDYILNDWWYPPTSSKNCYYTEFEFNDVRNDDLALYKEMGSTSNVSFETGSTRFKRNRLDGISIDFDVETYIKSGIQAYSLLDVARAENSKDFEFNCILIYYDIYKTSENAIIVDFDENENPIYENENNHDILATNLFGVLFLDNVESSVSLGGGKIPTFKKCRPNSVLNLNGNSYGFKINLKLDVSVNDSNVKVETVISDSNTLSMDIYASALNEMKRVSDIITKNSLDLLSLYSKIHNIESKINYLNPSYLNSLSNKINSLEEIFNDENTQISSILTTKQDILNLIDRNYETLNKILSGEIPSDISLNLDIFKQGPGIKLEKLNNKLLISSNDENYNYSNKISCSIVNDWKNDTNHFVYETQLMKGRNYLRITDNNFFIRKNLRLLINDIHNNWVIGQVFKIYFENSIELKNAFGDFSFSILTDASGKQNKNPYNIEIIKFDFNKFSEYNNKPNIEIHCIDDKSFKFLVDLF